MIISVTDAKGQLTELVRRAEAGEDVVLTRHGRETVKLVAVAATRPGPEARRKLLQTLKGLGVAKATPGASAARSHDDLYGEDGLPR